MSSLRVKRCGARIFLRDAWRAYYCEREHGHEGAHETSHERNYTPPYRIVWVSKRGSTLADVPSVSTLEARFNTIEEQDSRA